eukprot:COSAG01_NODE_3087_length_6609_cov_2.598925_3_plen_119_part_00
MTGQHMLQQQWADKLLDVTVNVLQGRGLAKMDGALGKADPYVIVKCGGASATTEVEKKTLTPVWGEPDVGVTFSFAEVGHGEVVEVELWDWDRYGEDDAMGRVRLAASELNGETLMGV